MKLMILAKARSIEEKYQRLLARRTDGTPEAMAAEDARLRDLVERCSGPAAVEVIRSADAEARAKVREDFGIEFASEGGYAAEVIDFHGLQVVIENPVGSVRAGVDPDGKAWATELTASYGYISGTEGADGDMVDVFVGQDASSTTAYVARCQVAGKWGTYDEDKVMLGFSSEEAAREAFLQNYNDPRFLGGMDAMSIEKLKERLGKPGRLAKAVVLLSKAHISAYTRKDGTFVKEHDDKRKPLAHDHLPTDNPADHAKVSLSVGSAAHVRADRIVASKANPADKARERGFRDAMMGLPSRRHEFSKISQVSYDQGVDRAKKTRETLKGRPWMETELERDGSKWRWAVYEEGRHIASGEAKTEKAAGQAVDDARVRAAEKRASAADITKSLLVFTKAHVGPYMRQGKLVNLAGYHGRDARAQAAVGQLSLFGSNEPAGPNPYKGKHPVHDTPDLFADADEHGEVPPARVLMPRRDAVTESRQELIAEHERLVDVLRSPSHEDDKAEAKKQAAELAEYKQGATSKAAETRARRSAVLEVLGEGWKAKAGVEGARDSYSKNFKQPDGGRIEVTILPQRTVDGNFYVGSYQHGGKRPGAGGFKYAQTIEEAKAVAEGMGRAKAGTFVPESAGLAKSMPVLLLRTVSRVQA